ncbi:hypothetical protein [Kibdelosporangium aridum]|uniref:hypothetical protein n=1 Tax=Kibdelosporangium aridum TaxID=2030 RepID=UPI0035E504D4
MFSADGVQQLLVALVPPPMTTPGPECPTAGQGLGGVVQSGGLHDAADHSGDLADRADQDDREDRDHDHDQ